MNRIVGVAVALLIPLGLSTTTHAQAVLSGDNPAYGVSAYAGQAYGGFGLTYSQELPAGSLVMDQYGFVRQVPYGVVEVPLVVPQLAVAARTRTRIVSSATNRRAAQPRYRLPTGYLGGSGGNGVMIYSPAGRIRSYGSGYGVGPYGVAEYSGMWHGMPIN